MEPTLAELVSFVIECGLGSFFCRGFLSVKKHVVSLVILSLFLGFVGLVAQANDPAVGVPPIAEQGEEETPPPSPAGHSKSVTPVVPASHGAGAGVGEEALPAAHAPVTPAARGGDVGEHASVKSGEQKSSEDSASIHENKKIKASENETEALPEPQKKGTGLLWFVGVFVTLVLVIFIFT